MRRAPLRQSKMRRTMRRLPTLLALLAAAAFGGFAATALRAGW